MKNTLKKAGFLLLLLCAKPQAHAAIYIGAELLTAASKGDRSEVHRLLKEIEGQSAQATIINYKDNSDMTALMHAAKNGHERITKWLARNGADTNATNAEGKTALMLAAAHNDDDDITEDLLAEGANPNAQDAKGYTALMYAVLNTHGDADDIIEKLIEHGAQIGIMNNQGETAFDLTTEQTDPKIVKMLRLGK